MGIQKLSIDLQNAVVTDGATITGDGTEGNPLTAHLMGDGSGAGLPPGGSVGQVLTKTGAGDGEAGWNTPASAEGGVSGPVRLSAESGDPLVVPRQPARTGSASEPFGDGLYVEVTPTESVSLAALIDAVVHGGAVVGRVWDAATGALLSTSAEVDTARQAASVYTLLFPEAVRLQAGHPYRIGLNCPTSGSVSTQGSGQVSWVGFAVGGTYYPNSRRSYPSGSISGQVPTFDLGLEPAELAPKAVLGPLDPVDVPRVSDLATLPPGGQALYTGVTPPRPVYRAPDGTLYYGPAYTLT